MQKTPSELGFIYDEGSLSRWVLDRSVEIGTDYSEDLMNGCCILKSECAGVSFRKAECRNVLFFDSSFDFCDFSEADLSGADFRLTNFKRCRFSQAILRDAELRGTGFIACDFEDADVRGARAGYLQSFLLGWSKEQRRVASRSVFGFLAMKSPTGG